MTVKQARKEYPRKKHMLKGLSERTLVWNRADGRGSHKDFSIFTEKHDKQQAFGPMRVGMKRDPYRHTHDYPMLDKKLPTSGVKHVGLAHKWKQYIKVKSYVKKNGIYVKNHKRRRPRG